MTLREAIPFRSFVDCIRVTTEEDQKNPVFLAKKPVFEPKNPVIVIFLL
jgi:hypothetical protein